MHLYDVFDVPDTLRPFIRRFLIADWSDELSIASKAKPTGFNYVGWVLRGRAEGRYADRVYVCDSGGSHVSGQIGLHDIDFILTGKLLHVLAEFEPLGLWRLLGIRGRSCQGEALPLENFCPDIAEILLEQSQASNLSGQEALGVFSTILEKKVSGALVAPRYLEAGLQVIEESGGTAPLSQVVSSAGISSRQFSRAFTDFVGLNPKLYCKTAQMNLVLNALLSGDNVKLTEAAHAVGYYDQAHFNHDMQKFFEGSPKKFLASVDSILATFNSRSRKGSEQP